VGTHSHAADAARGKVELAQVFARHGAAFQAANRLVPVQYRAMRAIATCRTEALGGHLERCDACAALRYHYHSCRNRHCPKCQTLAKERWLAARRAELLPVPYFHLVFTLPHVVNTLAQGNPRTIYSLLFETVSATLVLHTWGQTLSQHLHLHCLVAAGALGPTGQWIRPRRGFLFPVKALSQVFRGKFVAGLARAFATGRIDVAGSTMALAEPAHRARLLAALRDRSWVVYAKQPFGGPQQVLDYLGRYTHRVAISNHRLVSVSDQQVRFRYKDYAHGNARKVLALDATEFIRRFLLHVLPTGFMRIRHYGIIANRAKATKLTHARTALGQPSMPPPRPPESIVAFWLRIAQHNVQQCPYCRVGRMVVIAPLPTPRARAPPCHASP
jgi:Putative transposase/Transposase zinc-binding domain